MCQFPAVQQALVQAIQSTLPASLGSIDGEMSADERSAHVLDVCFLMSLLPVASGTPEAMHENLLGILSTVKVKALRNPRNIMCDRVTDISLALLSLLYGFLGAAHRRAATVFLRSCVWLLGMLCCGLCHSCVGVLELASRLLGCNTGKCRVT
jgi:hypothetical protein